MVMERLDFKGCFYTFSFFGYCICYNNSFLIMYKGKIELFFQRCLRGYAFAKLYFNVGDYEHAVRYVNSYLSVKPKSPEGHNLLGKALEKLGRKQSALEAYRTSLQLDPNQNNLVLKGRWPNKINYHIF